MVMRAIVALVLLLVLVGAGCGGRETAKKIPELRGQRLDLAEDRLQALGIDWEEIGGGNLGIVIRSHWWVCDQVPKPGRRATKVRLVVERECIPPPPAVIPNVVGLSLEDAEEVLDDHGIGHSAETYEGDAPLVEHFWEVCEQRPEGLSFVELYVARDCD